MRSMVLDELTASDMEKIRAYLAEKEKLSGIDDLYWVELDTSCLTPTQAGHEKCQPHRFAVETGQDFLKAEFFIRPTQGLRCHCAGYAEADQRLAVLAWVDRLIIDLEIQT